MNKWKAIVDTGATFAQAFFYYAGDDPIDLTGWNGAFKFFSSSGAPLLELGSPSAYGSVVVDAALGKLLLSVTTQGTSRLTGRTGTYELWITDGTTTLRLLDGPAQYRQSGAGSLDSVNVIVSRTTSAVTVERATINQLKIVDRGPPGRGGPSGPPGPNLVGGAAPPSVSTNIEGVSAYAARRDHSHDHDAQTDPDNHAIATQGAHGFFSSTDKTSHDHIAGARYYVPPPTGLTTEGADDAIIADMCAFLKSGSHSGGKTAILPPGQYQISVNTHNVDGAVGAWLVGAGGDFLRGTVFVTQRTGRAFGFDSCALGGCEKVNFYCSDPLATDPPVTFDGYPLGSDGASMVIRDCQWFQPSPHSTTSVPTVTATGSGAPAVTLARNASGPYPYTAFRLVVEIQSSTTFRYSTTGGTKTGGIGNDGNGDGVWEGTGLTIPNGGSYTLTGMMAGLKLNFAAGTYTTAHSYQAGAGCRQMLFIQNTFCCTVHNGLINGGYDGIFATAVGNDITLGTCAQVGRYTVVHGGSGGTIIVAAEPGGDGNGRGGVWLTGARGVSVTLWTGDAIETGPWVRMTHTSGCHVNGHYALTVSGAAILLENGCFGTTIRGEYSLCPSIVDTAGPTINEGIWIEANYYGTEANAITGVSYDKFSIITPTINRYQTINANSATIAFARFTSSTLPASNEASIGYFASSSPVTHGAGVSGGGFIAVGAPAGQHADLPVGTVMIVPVQTQAGAGFAPMIYDASHAKKMIPGLLVTPSGVKFYSPGSALRVTDWFTVNNSGELLTGTTKLVMPDGTASSHGATYGQLIAKIKAGAYNQNLAFNSALAALTSETKTVTVTGAAVGDDVVCNARAALPDAVTWQAWVSATDTVSLKLYNGLAAGTVDNSGARFDFTILKG